MSVYRNLSTKIKPESLSSSYFTETPCGISIKTFISSGGFFPTGKSLIFIIISLLSTFVIGLSKGLDLLTMLGLGSLLLNHLQPQASVPLLEQIFHQFFSTFQL